MALYRHVYSGKPIRNSSPQKCKYLIFLLSKAKQLAHEKVDHLPTRNLEDKQVSGANNHNLYKNNKINDLVHYKMFSLVNFFHVPFYIILGLRILSTLSISSSDIFRFLLILHFVFFLQDNFRRMSRRRFVCSRISK